MKKKTLILAIETSCDDSAVALLDEDGTIIANEISSQIDLHKIYGGVVPEIASRKHLVTLPILLRTTLNHHKVELTDLKAIAVTTAPGLIGSLLVGVTYAKTLAWVAKAPLIGVDHLEGHLLAPFLENRDLTFPYLALVASGGHTHLIQANALGDYQLLGKTIDDAAGEAYDKVAKMMGFQYPGGPIIEALAQRCHQPDIDFPIPLIGKKTLNFSFSGLKTAVRNEALSRGVYVERRRLYSLEEFFANEDDQTINQVVNIAGSFQKVMEEIVLRKMKAALKKSQVDTIVVSGGVASNKGIRDRLIQYARNKRVRFFHPGNMNCTDNAAMIGYTALKYLQSGKTDFGDPLRITADSKSPIGLMSVVSGDELRRNSD